MKQKTLLLLFMMLCWVYYGHAQQWNVYDGSVLPDANDPAFTENTGANQSDIWTIQDDPDIAGNKYLEMKVDSSGTALWQINEDPTPSGFTIVARIQALDTAKYAKVIEFDTRLNPKRQKLVIANNGEIELQRAASSKVTPDGLDVTKWHIYRYTFDIASGNAAVYIDEELVAVNTTVTTDATTDSYWRFGDGSGGNMYGAKIDWIVWDKTGAYSPSEQPMDLDMPGVRKRWALYNGDVIPDVNDPAFTENSSSVQSDIWSIQDDPDIVGNTYLEMKSDSSGTALWQIDYASAPTSFTMVARVKALDTTKYVKVVEFDTRFNPLRQKFVISRDGELELQRSQSSKVTPDGINVADWNLYRYSFNIETGEATIYLNENKIAVNTTTSDEASTDSYFRFGDGSGGNTYGAMIDWIAWDTTGAYSPEEYPVYKDLPGADIEPVRNILFSARNENVDPITGEPRDKPFIDTLEALGYNVTVRYDNNIHLLTESEFSVYNNADLVIIGRSGSSGDFRNNNKAGWNRIKSPVLNMSPFAVRSNRLNWYNTDQAPGIDPMPLDSAIKAKIWMPNDPAFADATIPADSIIDWFIGPYRYLQTVDSVLDQSNGSNLAEIKFGDGVDNRSLLFGRFDTGVEFYTNAGDSAAGPRTYFGLGNDDTTYYNLTDDALAIWLKEVENMASMSYTSLDFPSPNAGLSSITLNDIGIQGFESGLLDYTISVEGTTPPVVGGALINADADTVITQASGVPGTATIVVTAPDGVTTNTYTINFESQSATGPRILFIADDAANGGAGDKAITDQLSEWGYRVTYMHQDDYQAFPPDHTNWDLVVFSESMSSQRTVIFANDGYPIPALVLEMAGVQDGRLGIGDYVGPPNDGVNDISVNQMKIVNEQHVLTKDVYTNGQVLDMFTSTDRLQGAGTPASSYNYTVLGEIEGYAGYNSWVAIEPSGLLGNRMVLFGFFDEVAVTATADYWNIMQRNVLWLLDSLGGGTLTGLEDVDEFNFVAYPNPSSGNGNVSFKLTQDSKVNISVYNSMGRLVGILADEKYTKGKHSIDFNSSRFANGMYLFKLTTENRESMFKVLIEN